jgi:hypothetical protein
LNLFKNDSPQGKNRKVLQSRLDIMRIGVCGDNCDLCPRFQATENGSEEYLSEVTHLWLRLGIRDRLVSSDEIRCHGCTPENNCAYQEQRDCAFRQGLVNCGMCDSYPCEITERTFQKTDHLRRSIEGCPDFVHIEKAFFRKKEYLDRYRLEMRSGSLKQRVNEKETPL